MTEDQTNQTEATTEEVSAAVKTKTANTPKNKPIDGHWWWGTGRRKAAVARVRIQPGTGEFKVNNRTLEKYFTEIRDHKDILKVLEKSN